MRNSSDSLSDPDPSCKFTMPFRPFLPVYTLVFIGLAHFVRAVALSKDCVYASSARLARLSVVSYALSPTASSQGVPAPPASLRWAGLRLA
jgi:hypothetical protein